MSVKKEGTTKKKQTRKRASQTPLWKDRTAILLGALTIALAIVFALVLPDFIREYSGSDSSVQNDAADELDLPGYRHPITGALLYEPVDPPQLFGVMIDNHEAAWPPSGLNEAVLVVEAPVEASISRMLAFFTEEQEVEEIGPVRSARPYYLDWNNEFDAAYVHVGGSNAALDEIASGGTFDMNQYWWGEYFWRDDDKSAPHNVYTSSEYLLSFFEEREEAGKAPEVLYGLWQFKDAQELEGDPVGLYVDFWAPVYAVEWTYDAQSRQYLRDQGGDPHVTRDGEQIVADNVAVVITDIEIIDNVGRRDVRTTGEGDGYVLQDGVVIEAAWKKRSETERLRFYDEYDEEILMNAGVTWIEVVPDEGSVSFIES